MSKARSALFSAALAGVILAAGWFAGLALFVRDAALMTPPSASEKLQAVVALTGGSNRLDTAFDLLDQGLGQKLFISGVARGTEIRELLDRWKKDGARTLDCCVTLGFEADNTVGNAAETVAWLRQERYNRFYLVTANYHMKRALLEFAEAAPDLTPVPYPVAPSGIHLMRWWKEPVTRALMMREYAKYLAAGALHLFLRF